MTIAGVIFVSALGALFAFLFWEEFVVPIRERNALAAGAQRAETNEDLAQSEGRQSGPKGNAQNTPQNPSQPTPGTPS